MTTWMCGLRPCREPSGIGSSGFARARAVVVLLGLVLVSTVPATGAAGSLGSTERAPVSTVVLGSAASLVSA